MERLRADGGMTLIELLIAMVVMAIGVTAIVAGLSSGILTVQRAAKASSAAAFADQQMEAFRTLSFAAIATQGTATTAAAADITAGGYGADGSYNAVLKITSTSACAQNYCNPHQITPDQRYKIDTYVSWSCVDGVSAPTGTPPTSCPNVGSATGRAVKRVTVVARDNTTQSKTYFRETSTFDTLTG